MEKEIEKDHGRNQDFFRGGTLFQKNFKKLSKVFNNFHKKNAKNAKNALV